MRRVNRILLVEDNPGDAQLVRLALTEVLPSARLSGHEVLAAVRADGDPVVRRLPVVVLTSSRADADVARSYDLGANAHIAKPDDVDSLFALIATLTRYWFSAVTLPGGTAAPR